MKHFWHSQTNVYECFCDGNAFLSPVLRPDVDMTAVTQLSTVFSHGYLVSGHLPIHIFFQVLACILLGPSLERCQQRFI